MLLAVDERPVGAAKVLDGGAALFDQDRTMLPADQMALGTKLALLSPANEKLRPADGNLHSRLLSATITTLTSIACSFTANELAD